MITLVLLGVFALLAFFTPYTLDDWAWGDKIGAERLDTMFAGYNGRYLGNFLVLLITNSRPAMIICMALSFGIACLLPCCFTQKNATVFLVISSVLFFIVPRSIYAQIVGWASGYSNYVPPILCLMIYYVLIKNIFEDEKPVYSKAMPFFTFILGVAGALFMENITLTSMAIGVLIILFVIIKHRKLYLTLCTYLTGAVVGAAIMFTNSAYGLIGDGADSYRSVPKGTGEMIETAFDHLSLSVNHLFVWNIYFCIIASFVFVALCIVYTKSEQSKTKQKLASAFATVNLFALAVLFVKYRYGNWEIHSKKAMNLFVIAVAGLYCLSLLAGILLCVENKVVKYKLLLLFGTIICIVAPLMIVNPITARCYYPPYFIMSVMVVLMFAYVYEKVELSVDVTRTIVTAMTGGLIALCIFYLNIFSTIHTYDNMRCEYIAKQNTNHEKVVKVTKLPYDDYLWGSTPGSDLWKDRFKVYYNIDENAEVKYIEPQKYKTFAENYDKKHPVTTQN